MGKIFLTGNTFFGREKALQMECRKQFKSVLEMDEHYISRWNEFVTDDDTVFVLGGFAQDPFTGSYAIENLNGDIVFIDSLVDKINKDAIRMYEDFVTFIDSQIFEITEKKSIISYFPLEFWSPNSDIFHFYCDETIIPDLNTVPNRLNCSINIFGRPMEIDALIEFVNEFNKLK